MAKIGIFKKISNLFGGTDEESPATNEPVESPQAEANCPQVEPQAIATTAPTQTIDSTPKPTLPPEPAAPPPQGVESTGPKYVEAPPRPKAKAEPDPIPEEPHLTIEQIINNDGPMVKIVIRGGAKTYAVCPKCEAMWNLKDRLTVIITKRLDKSLTCVACREVVSLPPDLDLRKI